jgi:hypothetical protein
MGYNAASVVSSSWRRYDHPASVRDLIASGPLAHLTTINADGSPQVTVVWVGIEDDEFVCAHRELMSGLPGSAISAILRRKLAFSFQ